MEGVGPGLISSTYDTQNTLPPCTAPRLHSPCPPLMKGGCHLPQSPRRK